MFERITTYLAEQFDFPKDSLHWDTTFKSLQLDSMDMVEMMMDMEEELGVKATVVATGGIARFVLPMCRHAIEYDRDLLLKGLALLYENNCREK